MKGDERMGTIKGLSVIGVGRVGSYAKAKKGHYSRSRKYWTIARWSDECSCQCRDLANGKHLHYPKGRVALEGAPRFKTKKAAQDYLDNMEEVNNGSV
jgi:hypothetical protein